MKPTIQELQQMYRKGGVYYDWGVNKTYIEKQTKIADEIYGRGIIPQPKDGKKTIILSTSANSGYAEARLQDKLGTENYLVISADVEIPETRYGNNVRMQHNAQELPFRPQSVDVVIDTLGAFFYAFHDNFEVFKKLIEEYFQVLNEGGLFIIDKGDYEGFNQYSDNCYKYMLTKFKYVNHYTNFAVFQKQTAEKSQSDPSALS